MALENLVDLEVEWAQFMFDRPGSRNGIPGWSQDQKWRMDNPGKRDKLFSYRNGGPRPDFTGSLEGSPELRMLSHLDAWIKAKGTPPPPPPPTGSELRWSPTKAGLSGWTGGPTTVPSSFPNYSLIVPTNGAQSIGPLDDNKDYYINLSFIDFKSGDNGASGRSLGCHILGGRNIVIVGADIMFHHTSRNDASGILIDRGNPAGVVFIEGVQITAPNCLVLRTARKVYIQNYRFVASSRLDNGNGTDLHADCIQIWGAEYHKDVVPMKGLFMDKGSMYSDFTCITPSIEISHDAGRGFPMVDPLIFEFWRTDMHPRWSDKKLPSQYMWAASGLRGDYQNNGPYPARVGETWAEPTMHSSGQYEKKIDDNVISVDLSPNLQTLPYEIKNPQGQNLYVSPPGNVGGNAPYNVAGAAGVGNYLTFDRIENMKTHKWWIGTPPASRGAVNGQFGPDGVGGRNYESPGFTE